MFSFNSRSKISLISQTFSLFKAIITYLVSKLVTTHSGSIVTLCHSMLELLYFIFILFLFYFILFFFYFLDNKDAHGISHNIIS